MNASLELTTAERELTVARRSFNTARRALETSLSQHGAREGAADRLIHHADEYGIDHTLQVLAKNPATFDFKESFPEKEWPALRAQLETAYEATHAVDLAMATVENLVRKDNSTRAKAILIADTPYVFDPKADTLQERDSGETVKADARVVETESNGTSKKREQERDR